MDLPLTWLSYYVDGAERELRRDQAEAQGQSPDKFGPRGTQT